MERLLKMDAPLIPMVVFSFIFNVLAGYAISVYVELDDLRRFFANFEVVAGRVRDYEVYAPSSLYFWAGCLLCFVVTGPIHAVYIAVWFGRNKHCIPRTSRDYRLVQTLLFFLMTALFTYAILIMPFSSGG